VRRWSRVEKIVSEIGEAIDDVEDPIAAMVTSIDARAGVNEFENVGLPI
jgi:hypothetical protein